MFLTNTIKSKPFNLFVITVFLLTQSTWVIADKMDAAALVGQNAARSVMDGAPMQQTGTSLSSPNFTYKDINGNTHTINGGVLATPNTGAPPTAGQQSQYNLFSTNNIYQDKTATKNLTNAYVNTHATMQDLAVDTVNQSAAQSHPPMTSDPVWVQSDATMNNLSTIAHTFADCSQSSTITNTPSVTHLADLRHCERKTVQSQNCSTHHNYDNSVFEMNGISSSAGAYQSCGPGCIWLWVGHNVDNNYYGGACTVFNQLTSVKVLKPGAILSAKMTYVRYDDHIQIKLNNNVVYQGHWQSGGFTNGVNCELGVSWTDAPNLDVTTEFKSVPPGGTLNFSTTTAVGGGGEGYSRIEIHYDPTKLAAADNWTPQSCVDAYTFAKNSPFCTSATATCTNQLQTGTYTNSLGTTYTEANLLPSPFTGVSNLCKDVKVSTSCDFTSGNLPCYTDINGNTQCPTNTNPVTNSCTTMAADPNCAFVTGSTVCVGGATDPATGRCLLYQDTYDCGYNVTVPNQTITNSVNCPGPIRCMGTACTQNIQETNKDFASTAAKMQAIKMMAMDTKCNISATGGGGPGTDCKVFTGKPAQCKKAVGGTANCCKEPSGISMADYLKMIYAVYSLNKAALAVESPGALLGSYQQFVHTAGRTYSNISSGVGSLWRSAKQSIFGGGSAQASAKVAVNTGTQAAKQGMISQFASKLTTKAANYVANTFGANTANLLFQQTTVSATGQISNSPIAQGGSYSSATLTGPLSSAAGAVMAAYMYYTLAVTIIRLAYKCTKPEFQLGAKRKLRSTHFVGSYCAQSALFACIEKKETYCEFSSPLARILNEQIRPQLGLGWGTAKSPNCTGMTINQISNVNWDLVDLSEWKAILSANNMLKTIQDTTMNKLTGSGNVMNVNGDRQTVLKRAQNTINTSNPGVVRETIRQNPLP